MEFKVKFRVLTLLFVEFGFGEYEAAAKEAAKKSLNPSFRGIWFRGPRNRGNLLPRPFVLTLLFVEFGFGAFKPLK